MCWTLENFWGELSEWSQATFGSDKERGPIGPLKHLAKEVSETLANPNDIMEYADCLFLVFDAARRAGFSYGELVCAVQRKLAINRAREWPKPTSNDPVEHVRTEKKEGYWTNPVHEHGGKWWFWDETWSDRVGPYATKELADHALIGYANHLDLEN